MIHKLRESEFGFFEIMRFTGLSDHVVVGNLKYLHYLVAHGSFADHAEHRTDIACGQVAADHAVSFYKRHSGTFSCGCHGGAYARRTGTGDQDIVFSGYFNRSVVGDCFHVLWGLMGGNGAGWREMGSYGAAWGGMGTPVILSPPGLS